MRLRTAFSMATPFVAAFLCFFAPLRANAGPLPVFSDTLVDFGETFVGQTAIRALYVANTGDAAYIITSVTVSPAVFGESTPFAIVEPGDTLRIDLTYTPTALGSDAGVLTIQSTIGATAIPVKGLCVEPTSFVYSPDSLLITVTSGDLDTAYVTLENVGPSTLTFETGFDVFSGTGVGGFFDNFESGTQFTSVAGPNYSYAIVPDANAPLGQNVIEVVGGDFYDFYGLYANLPAPTIFSRVRYWFKADPSSGVSAVLRMRNGSGYIVVNNYYDRNSQLYYVNINGSSLAVPAAPGQWHEVDIRFDEPTASWYLFFDGAQIANPGLYSWYPYEFVSIQLSNWEYSKSYFDAVRCTNRNGKSENLLTFLPPQGSVPAGSALSLGVVFDATGLSPEVYAGNIRLSTNSVPNPDTEIPFEMTVLPGSRLVSLTDTMDFDSVFVGFPEGRTIRLYNAGSEDMLVYNIAAADPAVTSVPAYGIIPGFDSLEVAVLLNASAPGTIATDLRIESISGEASVYVRAEAVHPPAVQWSPDTICVTLIQGQDTTVDLTLINAGLGALYYNLHGPGPDVNPLIKVWSFKNANTIGTPAQVLRDSNLQVTEGDALPQTIEALRAYDVLLFPRDDYYEIWSYMAWMPLLSQYVSEGGRVLFLGRAYNDILNATGLFEGYHTFSYVWDTAGQVISEPLHPMLDGVGLPLQPEQHFFAASYDAGTLQPVVRHNGYGALAGYRQKGNGLAAYVGYDYQFGNTSSKRLLLNTVRWLAGFAPPGWLDYNSGGGEIAPSDSLKLTVVLSADSVRGGMYQYLLRLTTNDPLRPVVNIPVKLIVVEAPEARFAADRYRTCDGQVQFINQTAYAPETFFWDFGDGQTSTDTMPMHTYDTSGLYPVTLVACNAFGCDTLRLDSLILVDLGGQFCDTLLMPGGQGKTVYSDACSGLLYDSGGPDGPYQNGEYCFATLETDSGKVFRLIIEEVNQETCCDYLYVYDGNNANSQQLLGLSSLPNGQRSVVSSGRYATVQFYSDGSANGTGFKIRWECAAEFPPVAGFTHGLYSCNNIIQFTNQSNGATSYFWDFGDGHYDSIVSPIHAFAQTGIFPVTLYAIRDNDTATFILPVQVSSVDFYANVVYPANAQVGTPVTFTANSPFPVNIVYWTINGQTSQGTLPVVATFFQTGTFPVQANIYGANGCLVVYNGFINIGPTSATGEAAARASDWQLSPNPAGDQTWLTYRGDAPAEVTYRLVNAFGALVGQGAWQPRSGDRLPMALGDLPAGTYVLWIDEPGYAGTALQLIRW
ncbi:MAG: PKD domain-containing protein [Saprospiraceae bacterium]|nr:PKD domain-containing protein [Saprospiraceae bacterium]